VHADLSPEHVELLHLVEGDDVRVTWSPDEAVALSR
jgi:hypothetical protein